MTTFAKKPNNDRIWWIIIIILIILMFISRLVNAQVDERQLQQTMFEKWSNDLRKQKHKERISFGIRASLLFVAGISDGTAEALRYHYKEFKRVFPNASDRFWNPAQSWPNKYKDGDPGKGPAYFGSTSFLVGTTDGFHLCRSVRNLHMLAAVTIPIYSKKKWYWYLIEAAGYYCAYTAGFTVSYDVVF